MPTVNIHLTFEAAQVATIDAYLEDVYRQTGLRVTRSQALRNLIGEQLRQRGYPWPDDPQRGGDRRSGREDAV